MRVISIAVLLGIVFGVGAPAARATRPEACFASRPSTPATSNPCTYRATVKGGVDASGDWVVHIKRLVGRRTVRVITVDSRRLPKSCGTTGPRTICPIGIIRPGDTVTSLARADGTVVGTGNPCPVPNPGAPPPIAGGEC